MTLLLVFSNENENFEKQINCAGDIDYEYVDDLLWTYVQKGFIVSLCVVGVKK